MGNCINVYLQKKMKLFQLISFVVFLISLSTFAQVKNEKEERVNAIEVPEISPRWILQTFACEKKIKWYKQTENDYQIFEAKFKFNGKRLSIEFETNGVLKNVEIETKPHEILSPARNEILKNFDETFTKFKIKKTQFEYLPLNNALVEFFKKIKNPLPQPDFYEIEVLGKTQNGVQLYEARFNALGQLVQMREIQTTTAINLKY